MAGHDSRTTSKMIRLYSLMLLFLGYRLSDSQDVSAKEQIYVLEDPLGEGNKKLIVVTNTDGVATACKIVQDRNAVDGILSASLDHNTLNLSLVERIALMADCIAFSNHQRRKRQAKEDDPDLNHLFDGKNIPGEGPTYFGFHVIVPGTKWCGPGNMAKSYDDLGPEVDTDKCCREHDHCNQLIAPGETKHNLTNNYSFYTLSCWCEYKFSACLKSIATSFSLAVGNGYFNLFSRPCFKIDYPVTGNCIHYRTFLKLSCREYERDVNSTKFYQWESADWDLSMITEIASLFFGK